MIIMAAWGCLLAIFLSVDSPQTAGMEERWTRIPGGEFQMGCVPSDRACDDNEAPRHRVVITREFWMMTVPVTVDVFRRGSVTAGIEMRPQPAWSGDNHPVVSVSWNEALAFCRVDGGRLRMEAEWEDAARGGLDGVLYPWGDEFDKGEPNTAGYAAEGEQTIRVCTLKPNGFGLHDVVGNVWQWVNDLYDGSYDNSVPTSDSWDSAGRFRVACVPREAGPKAPQGFEPGPVSGHLPELLHRVPP